VQKIIKKTYIFARNSTQKLLPPELPFLIRTCTKSFVGWGFVSDSTGGAYSAPQTPWMYLVSLLLGEGREEEG